MLFGRGTSRLVPSVSRRPAGAQSDECERPGATRQVLRSTDREEPARGVWCLLLRSCPPPPPRRRRPGRPLDAARCAGRCPGGVYRGRCLPCAVGQLGALSDECERPGAPRQVLRSTDREESARVVRCRSSLRSYGPRHRYRTRSTPGDTLAEVELSTVPDLSLLVNTAPRCRARVCMLASGMEPLPRLPGLPGPDATTCLLALVRHAPSWWSRAGHAPRCSGASSDI